MKRIVTMVTAGVMTLAIASMALAAPKERFGAYLPPNGKQGFNVSLEAGVRYRIKIKSETKGASFGMLLASFGIVGEAHTFGGHSAVIEYTPTLTKTYGLGVKNEGAVPGSFEVVVRADRD